MPHIIRNAGHGCLKSFLPDKVTVSRKFMKVRIPTPERRLNRFPDEVSFEEGAVIEPLACSLHAVRV